MAEQTPADEPHRRAVVGLPVWRAWHLYISPQALRTAWPWLVIRARLLPGDLQRLRGVTLAQRFMEQQNDTIANQAQSNGAQPGETGDASERKRVRVQRFLLVRHGQSTFNVEGRLPSQLPDVPLTDEGRRQAHQAAVALAGLNLSAIVSSPLERARETAEIIARGWGLPVREEPRLMDTEMGRWAGRKISEVSKDDPLWLAFVEKPTEPPEGIEGFEQVRQRVVAAIEDLRADPTAGDDVVVVAHADVIKLIIAHYTGVPLDGARFIVVGNASISALAFTDDHPPALMAVNWTMSPHWLVAPAPRAAATEASPESDKLAQRDGHPTTEEPETGAPSGVIM
jgi:broad specificity phosphatase PhoE